MPSFRVRERTLPFFLNIFLAQLPSESLSLTVNDDAKAQVDFRASGIEEADVRTMAEDKNETSPSAEGVEKPSQETEAVPPPAAKPDKDEQPTKECKEDEKKIEENGEGEKPKENGEEKSTPEPKDMRAIVLNGFGGLKSVKALRKPEPILGEGEVLIRVKAW